MAISKNIIELTDNFLIENNQFFKEAPINIEGLANSLGITIKVSDFNEEAAGLLIIKDGTTTIGVDSNSGPERKRFTIAHELGHFVLHLEKSKMFIDKLFYRQKSNGYTTRDEKIEREANFFAANILMPQKLILKSLENLTSSDLHDDSTINTLAKRFNVSSSAMLFRLINLGIL